MSNHKFPLVFLSLVAATLFLAPLARQEVFVLRDHFDYFQPLHWFTAQELQAGRLPHWNPYSASGEPWLANPQTNVFYPPAWLFVILPFATAYMLFLLFHLALLGWGAYFFFARDLARGAALVGATALMFSGPVLSLLDVSNNLATFAWIPLALWCAASRRAIAGGFVLAFAFLAGEPFFAAIAALLFAIVARNAKTIAIAALVAFGVSAIQLFPFLELLAGSDRAAGMDAADVLRESMPLRDWLRVAVPPTLDANAFDPSLTQHFIPVVYLGIVVLLLALLGAWRRKGWLALIAFTVIVAAGPVLLAQLPLTLFRYPARLVPLASLGVAAMAAAGWDRVRKDRRWLDLLAVLALSVDLVPRALPLLQSAPFRTDLVPYARTIGARTKILRVNEIDAARRAAWISGYLNLYDRRFDAHTAAPVGNERYLRLHRELLQHPRRELLDAFPVGYVLTSIALAPPFEPVARAATATMYRNPAAREMAVLVAGGEVTPAKWMLDTSSARSIVDAPRGGVVMIAQQDAPGWRVSVDGVEREKQRILGVFRAVSVPPGRHEVVWTYRSNAFVGGAAVTLLTFFSVVLFLFVKRWRERKIFHVSLES